MKISLNDYLLYLTDRCSRLITCSNNALFAKLVSEYRCRGIQIIPMCDIIDHGGNRIPDPDVVIKRMQLFLKDNNNLVLITGIDAYLEFIIERQRQNFFIGIRNMLDQQQYMVHLLVSENMIKREVFKNPRYEGAMNLVSFVDETQEMSLNIFLYSKHLAQGVSEIKSVRETMKALGEGIPFGEYSAWAEEDQLPKANYGHVMIIDNALEALHRIYHIFPQISNEQAESLLIESNKIDGSPIDLVVSRFGGADYFTCENAPARLSSLKDDPLWDTYVWFLKTKIKPETYLARVLSSGCRPKDFLEWYVIRTALEIVRSGKIMAEQTHERATAIKQIPSIKPLIARFVTESDELPGAEKFYNCGTNAELQGLIRRAGRYDLRYNYLPDVFKVIAPTILCYLSPNYDYSSRKLTEYFNRLRCYRMMNTIDEDFVSAAYDMSVPEEVKKRDSVLPLYDDENTALLVVDGMGAEYYPLLLNMAAMSGIRVQEKFIVSVNLPTSTEFNPIKWTRGIRLKEVKRMDNITHDGFSKHEKCNYEENLAELLVIVQETVLPRVIDGLKEFKRVVVTADHGASYLAVVAYQMGFARTLDWPESSLLDWRYTSSPKDIPVNQDLEIAYSPADGLKYYVVRGYNRLSKSGGKLYGLHGGATLEERLVPFVVFEKGDIMIQETIATPEAQFKEVDDFDCL